MTYPSRFTEFFGPNLWKVMHAVAFTYPEAPTDEQKKQYATFFNSLAPVIPCPGCGVHYQKYLDEHPVRVDNTEELSRWVYELHDTVNKRNHKTSPTYEEIKEDYTGFTEEKNQQLLTLSDKEQRRVMADPFLGRLDSSDSVSETIREGINDNRFISILLIFVVGAIGLYAIRKYTRCKRVAPAPQSNQSDS